MSDFHDYEFWRLCLLVQIRELEVDLKKKDYQHAIKEIIDCMTVALDALYYLRPDLPPTAHLMNRLSENAKKQIFSRDKKFYEEKLKHLEEELGYPQGITLEQASEIFIAAARARRESYD